MIKVDFSTIKLKGDKEIIAAEFIFLCVYFLEEHSKMFPGHEEEIFKDMTDYAVEMFKKKRRL